MNVREASNRWNINEKTVREYCRDDIIPDAYKEKRKFKSLLYEEWYIPEIEKPPARRSRLVTYLNKLVVIQEGAEPKFYGDQENVGKIYKYLSDNGFITKYTYQDNIYCSLKKVRITSEGQKLISMEEMKHKKSKKEITASIGIDGIKPKAELAFNASK